MGLDMYLGAEKYCGDWTHGKPEERKQYQAIASAVGLDGFRCEGSPSLTVSVNVAYWRKANAIHNWFTENVQGGEDDCKSHYVEREQLEELVEICKSVLAEAKTVPAKVCVGTSYTVEHPEGKAMLEDGQVVANPEVCAELLPTTSGFFFGNTDYDDGYLYDLNNTVEQLESVLSNPAFDGWDFNYRASW